MDRRYLPPLVMLVAGAVVSIHSLVTHMDINESLIRLLIVLVIFFFIGKIANALINKIISRDIMVEPEEEIESEDESIEPVSEENQQM